LIPQKSSPWLHHLYMEDSQTFTSKSDLDPELHTQTVNGLLDGSPWSLRSTFNSVGWSKESSLFPQQVSHSARPTIWVNSSLVYLLSPCMDLGSPSAGHRTPHLGHLQLPFSDTFYCPHLPLGTQLNPDYTTSLASKFNISPSLCKVQIFLNDNYKSLLSDHSLFTGLQLVTDTGQVQPISKMFCPHL
jgi:hypothetical protein